MRVYLIVLRRPYPTPSRRMYYLGSLWIEWELVTRRRVFRLVHAPFFLARYMVLAILIFLCVPFTSDFGFRWCALTAEWLRLHSVTSEYGTMRLACDGACLFFGPAPGGSG